LTEEPFCAAKRLRNHKGELTRVTDVIEVGVDNEPNVPHPARYPVRLAEQLIETFSPINGTVLDPFVGSGSTLAAAKKLRRNYIGFDLVPEYVELARERVNKQRVTLPVVHVDDDDEGIQAA
jgi:site-specific DNA-methyltransferase (adenine-specific)